MMIIKEVQIFTGHDLIPYGYVIVEDGIIKQVAAGDPPDVAHDGDGDETVIAKKGHTLMPGIIDAHIHALGGNVRSIEQSLRFGVTTVCDMHNDAQHIIKLKELASDPGNKGKFCDFKCAGLGAMIEGGWPAPVLRAEFHECPGKADELIAAWPKLKQASDAAPFVQAQIDESGASYIKLMHEVGDTLSMDLPRPPLEIQRAVVDAAHGRNLIAVGHAFSHAGAVDLLDAGADGLTHVFLDQPPNEAWIEKMKQNHAHCNPTLTCCASQTGEDTDLQARAHSDPLAQRMLFDTAPRKSIGLASKTSSARLQNAYVNTRAMYQAGIPIVVGSDAAGQAIGTPYGLGVYMEIHQLIHAVGMEPLAVLESATGLTADRFGFRDRGKIEIGRKADLVLVNGDVRQILKDPNRFCLPIEGVWRDGIPAEVYA